MGFISISELRTLITCDPDTGILTWLPREHDKKWTSRWAGKPALSARHSSGYLHGRIHNKIYYAHRVVWALCEGYWPTQKIDHINRNPADNRRSNLRDVDHSTNLLNVGLSKANTSGVSGVYQSTRDGKWNVDFTRQGKRFRSHGHDTIEDAMSAKRLMFSDGHRERRRLS